MNIYEYIYKYISIYLYIYPTRDFHQSHFTAPTTRGVSKAMKNTLTLPQILAEDARDAHSPSSLMGLARPAQGGPPDRSANETIMPVGSRSGFLESLSRMACTAVW